jgi:hypothetical protein
MATNSKFAAARSQYLRINLVQAAVSASRTDSSRGEPAATIAILQTTRPAATLGKWPI